MVQSAGKITLFPNPATGHVFNIKSTSTGPVVVNIFTLSGQLLSSASLQGQTLYPIRVPASVSANNYIVIQVIGPGETRAFNILVL